MHGRKPKAAFAIHTLPSFKQSVVPISSAAVGRKLGGKGTGRKHGRKYKRKRVRRGVNKEANGFIVQAGHNNNNNNTTTMFIQGTNKPYKGMTVGPVVS